MTIELRRSALYVPGANSKMLAKAHLHSADVLIFDLEDSVGPQEKVKAREHISAAMRSRSFDDEEIIVRVNPINTNWGANDVAKMSQLPLHGLLFPKIEGVEDITVVTKTLSAAGAGHLAIWLMIETPRAIVNIAAIAAASDRIECLMMGTADLAKEARIVHTPQRNGLITALSQSVMAARANGLDVIDGVHFQFKDAAGFHQACLQGRELGFDGKSLIHPSQIEEANRIFSPSQPALDEAARIIESWHSAQAAGKSMTVVDGKLIEHLHVKEAQHTLAIDAAIRRRVIINT